MIAYRVRLEHVDENLINRVEVLKNGKVIKEINPMVEVNSGIAWGYGGSGPDALAIILANEYFGKDNYDSYTAILNYIKEYDKDNDFYISHCDLKSLVN